MDNKETIQKVRKKLDVLDDKLIGLLLERMELINEVAGAKRAENIPTEDESRESDIMDRVLSGSSDEYRGEVAAFMRTILGLSKFRQRKLAFDGIDDLLLPPPKKPQKNNLTIAYQGLPGAWGEQAAVNLFSNAAYHNKQTFEDVFIAVKDGEADYGIVPIENSRTGAIGETYDLLRKYGCYITGQTTVNVSHCLMALPGTEIANIREVFSHPEGFNQCTDYLKKFAWDLSGCRNTAVAADMVADKGENRFAAIGSKRAAKLHGLVILQESIADDKNNNTRFIAIGSAPEYDSRCDMVSITFRTSHRSGALCEVLFNLMSAGINLSRIESRPMMGDKYCFFADLEGNIEDENVQRGLRHAGASCGYLEVLGCYPG
ncbi:MAG TPA: prephenate dehydratase domain-containing protein [Anaerovoracaceae bacterium]|nr:prephenate dehydratase domain-containing protein [Anaerovoracaceae bacterium]